LTTLRAVALFLSLFALALSLAAYWNASRVTPAPVEAPLYTGPTISTGKLAQTSVDTGPYYVPFVAPSTTQETKTWLTLGPYDNTVPGTSQPPTWLEFHDTLPDSFTIRVQGGRVWTLGELRRTK
jgi:hypothetical protein